LYLVAQSQLISIHTLIGLDIHWLNNVTPFVKNFTPF
jgi:hypothetical protein